MTKKKILIIDDDSDARAFYTSILDDLHLNFAEARDGEEGLEMLKAASPDLVLLDLMMPKKGGLRVFNEMKENPKYQDIPIVIVSGATKVTGVDMKHYVYERPYHDRKVAITKREIETKPVEYLEKPVNPKELRTVVARVLKLQPQVD